MPRLATWLRRYRREAGLNQAQVAKVLDLGSPSAVSRWEHGERVPNLKHLLELSVLYSRLVNDLVRPEYLRTRDRVHRRLGELGLR
jgi:transcriptional regulator with XRE-family HTH domain